MFLTLSVETTPPIFDTLQEDDPHICGKVDYAACNSTHSGSEPFRQEGANIASDLLKRKHGVNFAKQVREKK